MILLLRSFRPAPVLQLPVSLRQCTSIQQRLFHASPIVAARKPTGAIVKPIKQSSAPSKSHRKQHLETPVAAHSAKTASPPATTKTQDAPQPTSTPSTTFRHALFPRNTTPPKSDVSKPQYQAGGDHAFLRHLATSPKPTLLYQATKTPFYITWCFGAAGFLGLISNMHFGHVSQDLARGMNATAGVSLFAGLIWAACTIYICYGPVGLIKRISALPQPDQTKPTLLFEPVRFFFGKYPKPFEVKLRDLVVDRGFEEEITKFDATRDRRRTPGILDGFFDAVKNVYGANVKLFTRATTFAQIRIPGLKEAWKIDLRDCKALDGGRTLDRLIQRDTSEPDFMTKMFRR